MKNWTKILIGVVFLFGCQRWEYRHDTKFRNQLVGTYLIDSVTYHLPIIDTSNGNIRDTNYAVISHTDDFFQILASKDQINKNVINTGKFLDSFFTYEILAFNDDKTGFISINDCTDCIMPEVFKHFNGVHYVVFHDDKKLNLESRFLVNDSLYTSTIYLRKKQ